MSIVGLIAEIVVATGTVVGRAVAAARFFFNRGRAAQQEEAHRLKVEAELEELRRRMSGLSDAGDQ